MSGGILIADAQDERAARIASACQTRGFTTRLAQHGPAALEASLGEVPDVVVVADGLPMIPPDRLAEILRSNPRTQGVPFLFVGAEGAPAASGAFDEKLAADTEPERIAQRVESILGRQSRMEEVARQAEGEHAIAGKFTQISLLDLLQLMHLNRSTGTLEVARQQRRGREQGGRIFLRDGSVIQARVGRVEGEKALFRLLTWRDGRFAFTPDRVHAPARITVPTRALLLEGMRHLDEWNRVRGALPRLDAQVTLKVPSSALPHIVQPLTQEVLLLLELYARVGDVVDHCAYPDYQVLRTLQTLVERGIAEIRQPPHGGQAPGEAELLSTEQVRRLHEWLLGSAWTDISPDAKLLLLSGSPAASARFVELLEATPGTQLDPLPDGPPGADVLAPLARLVVDEAVGIEILHVPTVASCAPLWELAGHAALGSVLLLDEDAQSVRNLEGPLQALRKLPRARVVALAFGCGEGASPPEPETLRTALGLEEDEPLVRSDGEAKPQELVRRLLSAVIP